MPNEACQSTGSEKLEPEARNRRADIQGLRAVAVLVVVAFHSGLPAPGGFVGVDIFFVISGFVIAAMLRREWGRSGRIAMGQFYLRRFKRLTPAVALMTAFTMVVSAAVVSPLGPQQTAAQTAIGAMLLVANFVIAYTTGGYFNAAAETNPLLHTWSLSVEEQFYLIFPALLVLGWTVARKRYLRFSVYAAIAVVAVVSFSLAVAGSAGITFPGARILLGFYSPFTRAGEFAVGALLALALSRWAPRAGGISAVLGVLGLALVVASILVISERTPFPGVWTTLPVAGTLLLLFAGTDMSTTISRLLSSKPMVRVGDWSYSIYLWHWPFIVFAGYLWPGNATALLLAAAVSVIPAVASYYWVEQPIRNLPKIRFRRWAALVGTTILIPSVLAGIVALGASDGWWSQRVRGLQAATVPLHIVDKDRRCTKRAPIGSQGPEPCAWNENATGAPIYLLGDSNAGQFSEAFIRAATESKRPLYVATVNACPFVDLTFVDKRTGSNNAACKRYVQGSLQYLSAAKRGLIVIANADKYWNSDDFDAGVSTQQVSGEPSEKLASFRTGLWKTVERLRNAGHQVLLLQTVPRWWDASTNKPLWDPSRCTLVSALNGGCSAQQPLAKAQQDQSSVRAVVAKTAEAFSVSVWDPASSLCPSGICDTEGPVFWRYRDMDHISVQQSVALAPEIRKILDSTGLP